MADVNLTFDSLETGTIVGDQFLGDGVTITSLDSDHPPMIFDTADPTGGDEDLATDELGKVLILSEDGDSCDPDDNQGGGTLRFDFASPVTMNEVTLLDADEGATIELYDASGNLLFSQYFEGDPEAYFDAELGVEGVARMDIVLHGSAAIDNVSYAAPMLDGIVEGTEGDDVIDIDYDGDPEGDRIDSGDAILPGEAPDDDIVRAGGGDDIVHGGAGDDEIHGGDGDDTIHGGAGDDTIYGNEGADLVFGGDGDDVVYGQGDDESIYGEDGDDHLIGGRDDDYLSGGRGDDTLDGRSGDDTLDGGGDDDILIGGGGDDSLIGSWGDDTIDGGNNDDAISAGPGNDSVLGGSGDDVISTGSTPLPDTGYPGIYGPDANPRDDLDTVDGGDGDDRIFTGDDDDTVFGGAGDDHIDGGTDDDRIEGGDGDDTVIGSEGDDSILGGAGDDLIYGGLTTDDLDLVDETGEDLVTDNNRDVIDGGDGDDTIFGNDDDDTLLGGDGDDYLDGGVDDDELHGGDGDDTLTGGQGTDTATGGADRDLFLGGNGGDHVDGGSGGDDFDTLNLTGSGVDFVTYTSDDREDGVVTFLDGSTMTFEEIENVIPCFTPGTMIATPRGERAVETLREGDRILTRDNGIQEIRWIGQKRMTGRDLARTPHLRPVLIRAGALGNGLPERDMMVSPNHRVLMASDRAELYFAEREVLSAAKDLVGMAGIHRLDVIATTYVHFMFDRHEVVLSDGAWTESFQPGDWSLRGLDAAQRDEILELFPELRSRAGLAGYQAARRSLRTFETRLIRS